MKPGSPEVFLAV